MFVERIRSKQQGKVYESVLIRESYRDSGKVKHRTLANISKLPASSIKLIGRAL
ncbi:MAG: hypothetical protein HN849_27245, partial [Victivallales bacterium]|nr:hypothetical protein [Victivallales bacterium]